MITIAYLSKLHLANHSASNNKGNLMHLLYSERKHSSSLKALILHANTFYYGSCGHTCAATTLGADLTLWSRRMHRHIKLDVSLRSY